MDPGAQIGTKPEREPEVHLCPECDSEESGHFCRHCGTLLSGEEMVLCPRCHQVVPDGDFCNQCGQTLSGIALRLRQLALAGDDFWVTAQPPAAPSSGPELGVLEPDESVALAEAELPDWLQELSTESVPSDVEARIYPALRPIEDEEGGARPNTFFTATVLLLFVLLLGLVVLALFFLLRGGA